MVAARLARVADQLDRAAEETPPSRERSIDVLRAVAISLVVIGHWLAVAVTETDGEIDGVNALAVLGWAHPITWVFQVMPLFFVIGGYANAASIASNRESGGDALGWVLGRLERIVVPAVVLLGVLALSVPLARLFGVAHETASTGVWLASVPLWFLAAYVAVLLLAPTTHWLHRHAGRGVVAGMAALIVVADSARLAFDVDPLGYVNHVLVWLAFHQLGYWWRDGHLPATRSVGASLALGGFGAAALLTAVGPYPVSMVGVPGEDLQNTAPPTVALLALGVGQLGLALALRDPIDRLAQRRRVWLAVVSLNAVILTIFLWHLVAAIVAALALYATGLVPAVPVDSGTWLALRTMWLPACLLALAVLVAAAGGVELSMPGVRKGRVVPETAPAAAGWGGGTAVLAGLVGIAVAGDEVHGPLGLPTGSLGLIALGVGLLVLTRRAHRRAEALRSA